ncbi:MAG: YIP1 family protein [Anaerolineae bacterium]|nr:YIP1 family protein [Anaerolineae bacterium]
MLVDRVMRVIKLDKTVYAEVEHDETAMTQAAIVVAIVAILAGLGGGINTAIQGGGFGAMILSLVVLALVSFVNWIVWAAITYFVGTKAFGGEADLGEMLRVIGFAYAPQILSIFSFIPCLGALISLAGSLMSIYTSFLAIKEGLDLDTNKTIATVVIGWLITFVLGSVIALVTGVGGFGFAALSGAFSG